MSDRCAGCKKVLFHDKVVEINTETTTFRFCLNCCKLGFEVLLKQKKLNPEEKELMKSLEKVLVTEKIIHQA